MNVVPHAAWKRIDELQRRERELLRHNGELAEDVGNARDERKRAQNRVVVLEEAIERVLEGSGIASWLDMQMVLREALGKSARIQHSLKSSPSDLQKETFAGNEGAKDTEVP